MKQRIILDDDDIHGLRDGRPLLLNDSSGTQIEIVYEWVADDAKSSAKPTAKVKRKYKRRISSGNAATTREEPDEGGLFECERCGEEFSSRRAYGGHMSGHTRREQRTEG